MFKFVIPYKYIKEALLITRCVLFNVTDHKHSFVGSGMFAGAIAIRYWAVGLGEAYPL